MFVSEDGAFTTSFPDCGIGGKGLEVAATEDIFIEGQPLLKGQS